MFLLLMYIDLKRGWKEKCQEHLLDLYGWSGSVSVITAYALTSFDHENLLLIDVLNLYGSLAIGIITFKAQVWQAAILEIAWFFVGSYSMIKNIIDDDDLSSSC